MLISYEPGVLRHQHYASPSLSFYRHASVYGFCFSLSFIILITSFFNQPITTKYRSLFIKINKIYSYKDVLFTKKDIFIKITHNQNKPI